MEITIELTEELESRLKKVADELGLSTEDTAKLIIANHLKTPSSPLTELWDKVKPHVRLYFERWARGGR